MNNLALAAMVVGVIAASAGASCAGFKMLSAKEPVACAWVPTVAEAGTFSQTPREISEDVPATRQTPMQDQHRVAGTIARQW